MIPEKCYFELPTEKDPNVKLSPFSPKNREVGVDVYKWDINKAFFVIVGKWGSTEWYKNKYVTIASNITEEYWFNSFVVENPWISWDDPELYFDCAMWFIHEKMKEFWYDNRESYWFWHSAWWHFLWRYAYKYPEISKILLHNPVLRQDFRLLKKWLANFQWEMTIIHWEFDVDIFFQPLLKEFESKWNILVQKWADHQYTQEWWLELFISLPETYLFNN